MRVRTCDAGSNCNYGSDGDNVRGLMSITRLDSWTSNNGNTINLSDSVIRASGWEKYLYYLFTHNCRRLHSIGIKMVHNKNKCDCVSCPFGLQFVGFNIIL